MKLTLTQIEAAAEVVYEVMAPTPQYCWPLLCERLGTEVWVKHENHTPVGAFKIRGGLVYFHDLTSRTDTPRGVISATRGNHGQSVGFAARRYGIPATIVVPFGNSREKNAAMRALGVDLIEHGEDFQAALEHAVFLAKDRDLHMVPSFHPLLVQGVATYALELLHHARQLDVIYVPIGLGSGISGMIAAREALGLSTSIVGVVSKHAPAYQLSFQERVPVEHPVTTQLADGVACRTPEPAALEIIWKGVDRIVAVSDEQVAEAMRALFEDTHNVAEGAGAASLAAALSERDFLAGKRVAVVMSGGNVDRDIFVGVLTGITQK
ncbi:MAG: threonine dehydratase [Desulfomonile tiedjei]|uniref:Threonine dehydratase n=1 Tax=Desulfomonile tiedjei TaxID=2358 RepID=A0A9D6V5H3_9BACT|nr:threonine dehydratase [Desulfomonile tiedjei]